MGKNCPQTVSSPGKKLTPMAQVLSQLRLQQKALEVIARTPEVRCEKVQAIKNLLEKSSYAGNSPQTAVNLLRNHFVLTSLVADR
jgi:hypothetical protein